MSNEQAVEVLRTLPERAGRQWSELFPSISAQASSLLSSMMTFNPSDRCTMEDALLSQYLAPLRLGRPLPPIERRSAFDVSYDGVDAEELRERIFAQMLSLQRQPLAGFDDASDDASADTAAAEESAAADAGEAA